MYMITNILIDPHVGVPGIITMGYGLQVRGIRNLKLNCMLEASV